jgi:RNA polymerase sigma-70 factor (ECF subfamily)
MAGGNPAARPETIEGRQSDSYAADLDLVRRARAGDDRAFTELVELNRRAVYRAAYAALGSAHDADDVAQETFVTAFQKLHSFRGEASLKTWLLSIAWRKALDRRRSLTRWLRMTVVHGRTDDDGPELIERMASGDRSQEDTMSSDELRQTVQRLIGTLPRKLRDVLLLVGCEEYSYEQIGRMLGLPIGTVKWRVAEARRILKRKLAALGHGHD